MLTALVLTVSLASIPATPEGVHLSGVTAESRSARLIAQAPPPLPVRPSDSAPMGVREGQIQSEIDAINTQLRGLKTDWPTASVVMAYLGWSLSPVALVGLLVLALGGATGIATITLVGIVLLVIGLGGVALGIAGVVTGIAGQNAAKAERDELLQRRGELERELKGLKQNSPGVDRSFESSPRLFTIAAF
jgi:hypothetical protein